MRDAIRFHHGPVIRPSSRILSANGRLRVRRMAVVGLLLAVCGCDYTNGDSSHKINGAVHVAAGPAPSSAETVNGSIDIDPNATVTQVATVNGNIHCGAHATATSIRSVNGRISLDEGAHVTGVVESVNGAVSVGDGADVAGALKNVSGTIELRNAHVAGGIRTVAGNISVLGSSRVEGGIVVEKPGGTFISIGSSIPRIVVGPGASVAGELRFEREVHLFVSDKATVGAITGATAVSFTDDQPPG